MEVVVLLRQLWRRRLWVVLAALVAGVIGLLMTFKISPPFKLESRAYTVGISSTTAMLDTPSSQVVDLGDQSEASASAGSLPGRAALISSVLTTSPLKEEIAKSAGIDPKTLIAGQPSAGTQLPAAPIGSISIKNREASILTIATYERLPIIDVSVTAPDAATAAKLSNGAIKVLIGHLNSLASADGVPTERRLVVKQLGEARVATAQRGPSRKFAAVTVVVLFSLFCAGILSIGWVATRWRDAENWESRQPSIDWDSIIGQIDLAAPHETGPAKAPAQEPVTAVNGRGKAAPPPPPPASSNRWDSVG